MLALELIVGRDMSLAFPCCGFSLDDNDLHKFSRFINILSGFRRKIKGAGGDWKR